MARFKEHLKNLEEEMNTSLMISRIEKLLPAVQKREWTLIRKGIIRNNKPCTFESLLNFLKAEREAIEYMDDELRSVTKRSVKSDERKLVNVVQEVNELQTLKEMIEGLVQVVKGIPSDYVRDKFAHRRVMNNKKCWYHSVDHHDIESCNTFKSLNPQTRIDQVKRNFVFFVCLQSGRISRYCESRATCAVVLDNGSTCNKRHHELLHVYNIQGLSSHSGLHGQHGALLMVSEVLIEKGSLAILWDPGANVSLITHTAARRLGLKGYDISLKLTKVGNQCESVDTKSYLLPLIDGTGKTWKIPVYGMDDITSKQPDVDMKKVCEIFNIKGRLTIPWPNGKIDALIGTDWVLYQRASPRIEYKFIKE